MKQRGVAAAALTSLVFLALPANSSPTHSSRLNVKARVAAPPALTFIKALVFDPHDSKTIWAVRDGDRLLYRTTDGARSWGRVNFLPPGETIGAIALGSTGRDLYVAAQYHPLMWQSSDAGATWRRVSTWPKQIAPVGATAKVAAIAAHIAIHPSHPETVYAVTENVVLRSDDSGRSWRRASRGLPRGRPYYPWWSGAFLFHPAQPDVLYFVTHSKGLYRSDNGGEQWVRTSRTCARDCLTRAHIKPGNGDYLRLAIDPTRPNRLFAGSPDRIYRSSDSGDRWQPTLTIQRGWLTEGLAVAGDGTVYVDGTFTPSGAKRPVVTVARSADAGKRWARTLRFRSWPRRAAYVAAGALAVDPRDPAVVLVAVGVGNSGGAPVCVRVLKTTNRGQTWKPADSGLVPTRAACRLG